MATLREHLVLRLAQCPKCLASFKDNIALILPDANVMTEQQTAAALTFVKKMHESHA